MLRMDISTLRRSELRSLLAAARARGQDDFAEQLESELAGRADDRPVAARELRSWAAVAPEDEVLPMDPHLDDADLDLALALPERRLAQRRPLGVIALAAVIGAVAGGSAVAWKLHAPTTGQAAMPQAAAVAAAKPSPELRVVARQPESPAPSPPEDVQAGPAPPKPAPPVEARPPAAAHRPQVVARAEQVHERPRRMDPCAAPPSPADRTLCNDLGLNLLEHEMREAYGRALESGADALALREDQAAWRRVRDPVSDPRTLARLYDSRIRELNDAAQGY